MWYLYTDIEVLAFSRWPVEEEQKSVLHENERSASTKKITQVPHKEILQLFSSKNGKHQPHEELWELF